MGVGLIYGLIILLIIFIFSIIWFIYSRKKKSVVGQIISAILILGVAYCFLINNIDEWTISKKDVIADLKHLNIQLKNKFEITSNKVTGMPERYQQTELSLSSTDKQNLLDNIKLSSNYKKFSTEKDYLADTTINLINKEGQIINYSYQNLFHREKYSLIDNYPTRLILTLDEKSNKVNYERIED